MLLEIKKKYYRFPQSWDDLTPGQLARVMEIFHAGLDIETGRLHLFKVLTGMSWLKLWYTGAREIEDKFHITDFLFQDNTLTKNVLPFYKGKYGPSNSFNNLLVSEFIFSEHLFIAFKKKDIGPAQKMEKLDQIVAILYREGKPGYDLARNADGDPREGFNENLLQYNCRKISRWPEGVKLGIAHWYEGCRINLTREFPEVFQEAESSELSQYGLWDMVYNIADKGIFGNFELVEKQYLKTILMAVTKMMMEAARLEKQMKKA